jgi:hypothetical protein
MPSSDKYVRDYTQEYKTAKARGESKGHAERLRLRRKAVKLGMVKPHDGKDVDHTKALSKGGSNSISNARVRSPAQNRSFPRRADGSMIRNEPEKK